MKKKNKEYEAMQKRNRELESALVMAQASMDEALRAQPLPPTPLAAQIDSGMVSATEIVTVTDDRPHSPLRSTTDTPSKWLPITSTVATQPVSFSAPPPRGYSPYGAAFVDDTVAEVPIAQTSLGGAEGVLM